jgi:type IX secretion system PorP/SprF family membrane protein
MKKFFTTLTLALTALMNNSFAQQDPQFTQFMHNKLIYNPGYAGTSDAICSNVLYRQQWVSFPGAPRTALLSFDMPLGSLPIGVGLNVMSDQLGFDKSLFARLAVSYRKVIGAGTLGLGIDAGILQKSFDGAWITPDGNGVQDNSIPGYTSGTGTNVATNSGLNKMTYDLGFGAYYTIANKFYVGLSSTHLSAQDVKANSNIKYALARHYYIMSGYTFDLTPEHAVTPNINIKSDGTSTQLDLNVTYMFDKTYWFGLTYRMQDAIAPMLGAKFLPNKSLKVGYSYDVTTSKMRGHSSGSHEIMIGYCFNVKRTPKITSYQNARFLD